MVQIISTDTEKDKDYGLATSIAAGVGSGIFKIFEGAATLGATLLDLGIDKDRAEAVEAFFDKINPFDEAAAATGAGTGFTATVNDIDIPNTQDRGVCVFIGASTGIATLTVIMESGRQAVFKTLSGGTVLPILIKRVTGGISATNDVLALY